MFSRDSSDLSGGGGGGDDGSGMAAIKQTKFMYKAPGKQRQSCSRKFKVIIVDNNVGQTFEYGSAL